MGRFGLGVGMCRRDAFDEIVVERGKRQQEASFNFETLDLVVVNVSSFDVQMMMHNEDQGKSLLKGPFAPSHLIMCYYS